MKPIHSTFLSYCYGFEIPAAMKMFGRQWPRIFAVLVLAPVLSAAFAQKVEVTAAGTPDLWYPFSLPPGIASMTPRVGLAYTGGANGAVGAGWAIRGISSIARCPSSKATDGAVRAVAFDGDDKLCLDGQRLIQADAAGSVLTAAQSGCAAPTAGRFQCNDSLGSMAPGTSREYRTEKDSFVRVRAYGAAAGVAAAGPAFFRVWTKDGQVAEYGNSSNTTANSLQYAPETSAVKVWAISRTTDSLGNYIDFEYQQRLLLWGTPQVPHTPIPDIRATSTVRAEGGRQINIIPGPIDPVYDITPGQEWVLKEIRYTGRPSQAPANKLVFEYEDRSLTPPTGANDVAESFQDGTKALVAWRLSKVTSYVNAQAGATPVKARTYKLSYVPSKRTGRSVLTSIQECGGSDDTVCLPPTKLAYSAGGTEDYVKSSSFDSGTLATRALFKPDGSIGTLTGDFNGDGKLDILRWMAASPQNELHVSSGNGAFSQVPAGAGSGQFNLNSVVLFSTDGCYGAVAQDFNGDGLTDVLRYHSAIKGDGTACTTGDSVLYISKGDGSFQSKSLGTLLPMQRMVSQWLSSCLQYWGSGECMEPGLVDKAWTRGESFYVLDTNGDGYLDIVTTVLPQRTAANGPINDPCLTSTCTRLFLGSASGDFTEKLDSNLAHYSLYTEPTPRYLPQSTPDTGDVNGDGRLDIVGVSTSYWGAASAFASKGDGNFSPLADTAMALNRGCMYPLDFNGDGLSDCLNVSHEPASLYVGTGQSGSRWVPQSSVPGSLVGWNISVSPSRLNTGVVIADVNGDGRSDIIRWQDDAAGNAVYLSNGDGSFRTSNTFNLAGVQLKHGDGNTDFVVGDFSGRGAVEILRLKAAPEGGGANANQLYLKSSAMPPDLLIAATTSSGLRTDLTWVAPPDSSRYSSDRSLPNSPNVKAATYPSVDITPHAYVVASMSTDSGVPGQRLDTEFAYLGFKDSYEGRGSLGFREFRKQGRAPDGSLLTQSSEYLQIYPYTGATATTRTTVGSLAAVGSAQQLQISSSTYCDKTSPQGSETTAMVSAPCVVPNATKIQRPYLAKNIVESADLSGAPLPKVTTTYSVNNSGDPVRIEVKTEGSTLAGPQSTTQVTTNDICEPDSAGCPNKTASDAWILGRVQRTTQQNSSNESIAEIPTSAGTGTYASAAQGVGPPIIKTVVTLITATTTSPTVATGSVSFNNLGQTATVLTPFLTGGATVSPATLNCQPNSSCGPFTLSTPSVAGVATPGTYNGSLTFVSMPSGTVPAPITVNLKVNAAAATPPSITTGTTSISSTTTSPAAASGSASFTNAGQTASTLTPIVDGGAIVTPASLSCPASGSCGSFTVTTPSVAGVATPGTYNGTLAVSSSAGGTVPNGVTLTLKVNPSLPIISAAPGSIISTTVTPTPASGSVSFTNAGQTPTTLTPSVIGGAAVTPSQLNCPANGACGSFTVTSPAAAGTYNGSLSVVSTAGGTVPAAVPLTLKVQSLPSLSGTPNPVNFGTVQRNEQPSRDVMITNSGDLGAAGLSYVFSYDMESDIGYYNILSNYSNCPVGGTLGKGQCTLKIAYTPSCGTGNLPGTLTISGTNFPQLVIGLAAGTANGMSCNKAPPGPILPPEPVEPALVGGKS